MDKGKEDYESDAAQQVKGMRETYSLIKSDGLCRLTIELDTSEEYYGMMAASWDNALQKIKELAIAK